MIRSTMSPGFTLSCLSTDAHAPTVVIVIEQMLNGPGGLPTVGRVQQNVRRTLHETACDAMVPGVRPRTG